MLLVFPVSWGAGVAMNPARVIVETLTVFLGAIPAAVAQGFAVFATEDLQRHVALTEGRADGVVFHSLGKWMS